MKRAAALSLLFALASAGALSAQTGQSAEREPIRDNSFLVEEAYNQDPRVVQHISSFAHPLRGADWVYTFTQEWPLGGQRHQLSATIPISEVSDPRHRAGLGDVAVNYRLQLLGLGGGALASAPRLTVILPTGSYHSGLGSGALGVQTVIPVSVQLSRHWVTHWNAGLTHVNTAREPNGGHAAVTDYLLGGSLIWLAAQRVNLLLETEWASVETPAANHATTRGEELMLSPGVRWSYDFANGLQIVPGLAEPIGVGPSRGEHSVFAYLSFEHPF